ncbi:MAG: hypothetical protein HKN21_09715 [Candidatus Eisenbacteria bacterium]|uniref:Tetratricopeptide repeat protein n=1 Tax=Eiseniibacteriota bacterium TaxID=2212470 RepID=A0A7Y2H2H9_UNCEI|nr:hypothetical protein [Candidatus Eisenbacteria bacterium]
MIHRVPHRRFSIALGVALSCVLLCLSFSTAWSHGAEHALIEAATKAIEEEPSRPELWLHRGELHREHQSFKKAAADYTKAESLGADPRLLTLCRAELALDDSRPEACLQLLDHEALARDIDGTRMRAAALFDLQKPEEAVRSLALALELDHESRPSHYLELALAYQDLGQTEDGLSILDEGIEALGSVTSLELEAVAFEQQLKRFDAALARLDRLETQFQRKETLLVRRATVLRASGRELEAEAAYTEALLCIEALSPKLRKTDLVQQLEAEIHRALTK